MSAAVRNTELEQALSEALREAAPGPVAWAGAGGSAHYAALGHPSKSLERIASWAEGELDLLRLALGWKHARRDPAVLTLVVEDLPPGLLEACEQARARRESLLVVLLDPRRRYAAERRTVFGRGAASPAAYLQARGFPLAAVAADRPERLLRTLEGVAAEEGVRFLHVLGPEPSRSSSDEHPAVRRPGRATVDGGWPGPDGPTSDAPDSLEAQVLGRLAADLLEQGRAVCFWTRSAPPGPLSALGRRLRFTALAGCLVEAAGAAAAGAHPVVALSAPRVPDLVPDLLEMAVFPLTLLVLGGGLSPLTGSGEPHPAGLRDLAFLRNLRGLTVAVPSDEEESRGVLRALLNLPGPAALRLASSPAVGMPGTEAGRALEPGTGRRLREGREVSLVALGSTVFPAVLASQALASWGIGAGVYDMRYLEPLDEPLLREAASTGRVVTVEEHSPRGGLGTAVLETLTRDGRRDVAVRCLGVREDDTDCSLESHGLGAEGIAAAVREILGLGVASGQ